MAHRAASPRSALRSRTVRRGARTAAAAAILVGTLPLNAPAGAAPSQTGGVSHEITAVNGQDGRSGVVADPIAEDLLTVDGIATVLDTLVAEAGSSTTTVLGADVELSGFGSRGTAPYTYSWTVDGSTDGIADPNQAEIRVDSAVVGLGVHTATLTVTDGDGNTASDDVRFVVQDLASTTLLEDATVSSDVCANGVPEALYPYDFAVPAGASNLVVNLDWATGVDQSPAEDFDMEVTGPGASGSAASLDKPEIVNIATPPPGDWTAEVACFTSAGGNQLTLLATADVPTPAVDLPIVDGNGPYSFPAGAPQNLSATVAGGTAPVAVAWDLNGDLVFETFGADITTSFPVGNYFVNVKATDAAGFEVFETVPLQIVPAGATPSTDPVVVVGVTDSGINAYHSEFRADGFPDPDILALTSDFTAHPSTYIDGFPATAPALDITLGDEYYPAADVPVWDAVVPGALYWIPGTKIIGARDTQSSSGVTAADDQIPILDEDGHGTSTASLVAGNTLGYCRTCVLMIGEGLDEDWMYGVEDGQIGRPEWIDIASNSFGTLGNVGGAGTGTFGGPAFPVGNAEDGQLSLYASGNGNENAFVTPQQTYTSNTLGPHWSIRVSAVTTGTGKPIVGSGKPVDISSYGSGTIPSAALDSVNGQSNFGGTSAATPISAGAFGEVLRQIRQYLGDAGTGYNRFTEAAAIAKGTPIATSQYLHDGVLTAAELREVMFKTSFHVDTDAIDVYPVTSPSNDAQYTVGGYGVVDGSNVGRAVEVLLGQACLPARPDGEEEFFAQDEAQRDALWGDWDNGGINSRLSDGAPAGCDVTPPLPAPGGDPLDGVAFGAAIDTPADGTVVDPTTTATIPATGRAVFSDAGNPAVVTRYWPRRDDCGGDADNMRVEDVDGPDGGNGCTLIAQAVGLTESYPFVPSALPITLTTAEPVSGTIFIGSFNGTGSANYQIRVELADGTTTVGEQTLSDVVLPTGDTAFDFEFPVDPALDGVALDALVLNVHIEMSQGPGHVSLDDPASFIDLPLADTSTTPARSVELSLDDPDFTAPIPALLSDDETTWTVLDIPTSTLADGTHTLCARAVQGAATSPLDCHDIVVTTGDAPPTRIEVAIYDDATGALLLGPALAADTSGRGDFSTWQAGFDISSLPAGDYRIESAFFVDGTPAGLDDAVFTRTTEPDAVVPEVPLVVLLPLVALLAAAVVGRRREETV